MLQFNCGLIPLTFCKASNIDGVGFALKNSLVYISTGAALSSFETSFKLLDITTSSILETSSCNLIFILMGSPFIISCIDL